MPLVRTPKMDIYENNGNVVVEAELPRIDPKNIDIEVKDNVLKVEAKTEEKKEEKGKGYYRKEISSGYFRRALPLPVEVIGEKAEASYREGILKITIPKVQAKKEEKEGIKIKVKGR
jgi:HSP20 family protein